MATVAGDRVILRGQTGMGLDEKLYGRGDPVAQAEKAMDNVATLLAEPADQEIGALPSGS